MRTVQTLRKKQGLKVKEKISLSLETDKKTESLLKKFLPGIKEGVGAEKVSFQKISEPKGELGFDNKRVRIEFKRSG